METAMSKGIDLVSLLEWAERQKTFKEPKTRFGRKKEKEFDLVSLLRKKKEEAELLEKFLKDQEKINKKEDKKEVKAHVFTFTEGLLMAFMAQYFLGPAIHAGLHAYGVQ